MNENGLRLFDPRKSSVWRLTLAFAAITAVTLLLAIILIYQLLLGEQSRQVERRLDAEKTRIEALASEFDKGSFFQQLDVFRNEGEILIFWQSEYEQSQQLSFLPDNIPALPQTIVFPVLDTGRGQIRLLTTGKVKTHHGDIVLATATEHLQRLIVDFKSIASWTFIIAIVLTGLFGYLFSRRHLRRVKYFNETAEQVQNGNLSARLCHKNKGDEFDRLAAHINTMLDAVEENFALVQGITDNIAHDLKTPLTRLKLNLEKRLEDQPQMGYELEQLNNIINTFDAMLKLTRLEHGQFPLKLEAIDSSQLTHDVCEILQPSAEQNGQIICVNITSPWRLNGDRNLIFQAIFNLVENAIKYAGKGATITLALDEKSFSVTDNGKGVNEQDLKQLTKRFYRSDPARQHEGFGLGLATVKAICNRHNLNLSLNSDDGFCVKITND